MNPAVIDLLECPNCGTPLVRRYCAQCGQKVGPINPTVHDFGHDLTHELLHVDGKIFSTCRRERILETEVGSVARNLRISNPERRRLLLAWTFMNRSFVGERNSRINWRASRQPGRLRLPTASRTSTGCACPRRS